MPTFDIESRLFANSTQKNATQTNGYCLNRNKSNNLRFFDNPNGNFLLQNMNSTNLHLDHCLGKF